MKTMVSNEIDAFRNICAICLNNEDGIKLYKMKMIDNFFVDIVGISQVEYKNAPKFLCVWCATLASRAVQLVSRARTSAGVLSHITKAGFDGNSQLGTAESKLHNLRRSTDSVVNIEITTKNYEDKPVLSIACRDLKSDGYITSESRDVLAKDSIKSESNDFILNEEDVSDKSEERENEKMCRIKLKRKSVKNQSRKRNKNGVKTEQGSSTAANPDGHDRDLRVLRFSVQNLTEEQQLAELERRRQTEEFRDAQYKCSHCALVFLCVGSEKNHAGRHKEIAGLNICPICNLRFATRGAYTHHRLGHRRFFFCLPCGRRIPRRTLLRRHRSRCPVDGFASDGFRCSACEKEFGDKESVRTHYMRVHSVAQKLLRCDHCEKTFTRKHNLIVHMRSHTQEKPYICQHCRRGFTVSSNLRAHIALIHQERLREVRAKPYCVECDRHFTTTRSLTRHLKRTAAHRLSN